MQSEYRPRPSENGMVMLHRLAPRCRLPDAKSPEGLRAAGFDVVHYVPQPFTTSDVDGASLVVSFDQNTTKTVAGRVQDPNSSGLGCRP